ncbi:hypothetical protein GCM10023222_07300 [Saccharopolyspora cebuensis]
MSIASPVIALVALLYSRYSTRIARQSLGLSRKTAQVSYEEVASSRKPAASLFLDEIEYRRSDLETMRKVEARRHQAEFDVDGLEVVIRGRLVNNLDQEILLTCRDHPHSGRSIWFSLKNESVFYVEGEEVRLADAVLPAGKEATFMWVDRRPKQDWINIYKLQNRNTWGDRELEIPRLSWYEVMRTLVRRERLHQARQGKIDRSGFDLICEPRTTERVATVWFAEVVSVPVEITGRDENERITFGERIETVSGPLDDKTVYYRARFDSTLALVDVPKMRYLIGRQI